MLYQDRNDQQQYNRGCKKEISFADELLANNDFTAILTYRQPVCNSLAAMGTRDKIVPFHDPFFYTLAYLSMNVVLPVAVIRWALSYKWHIVCPHEAFFTIGTLNLQHE
jgi:hypothetical protein